MNSDNSRVKIAMIGDYPLSHDRIDGGVQAVFAYLVNALCEYKDIELHIITLKKSVKQVKQIDADGYKLYVLPKQSLALLTWYYKDFRNIRQCLSEIKPHLIHSQGAGYNSYAALKSGYSTLVTFHGMLWEDSKYLSKFIYRIRMKLQSIFFENYTTNNNSHAILISPYVQHYFAGKLKAKTYFIPNPVHKDYFNLSYPEEKGRILFAGRVIPRKGVEDLLKALVIIKDKAKLKLVLAGSLNDRVYVNKIKKYINLHKMTDCVELSGHLNEENVKKEFAR